MLTEASKLALQGLRDLSKMEWYVIPFLALVLYIYAAEVRKARETYDWNAVFAGLTLFGMDFINESWNGWVFAISGHSACWTTPGYTALRTMVGWNIEIMFMFAIAGIVYYNMLSGEKKAKVLGLPEKWFWAIAFSIFCVFIECVLNYAGMLVWEYPFWNRTLSGIWLIFFFGYFHFFVAVIIVTGLIKDRSKVIAVTLIYLVAIGMNVFGLGIMGWRY